jgi:hypothetical protein
MRPGAGRVRTKRTRPADLPRASLTPHTPGCDPNLHPSGSPLERLRKKDPNHTDVTITAQRLKELEKNKQHNNKKEYNSITLTQI